MSRVYRATLKCIAADGTLMEPSLHYRTDVPGTGSEPDPNDVADAINTHLQAALRAILSSQDTYQECLVREMVLPPAIGVAGIAVQNSVGNLTTTDDWLPRGVVPIINIHTNVSSRSARGHIAGPSPGRTGIFKSGRVWSTTYQALLDSFAALLDDHMTLGSINATDLVPVVYSRTRHIRGDSPYSFNVSGATANPVPHWLRTRMSTP